MTAMNVTITYSDSESLTVEEVVKTAQGNYGKLVTVNISPESTMAYDYVYFGIQQLMTHRQISLMYEKGANYQNSIKNLRAEILSKLTEITDQVIVDNESKIST
jgi:hypothetical protein